MNMVCSIHMPHITIYHIISLCSYRKYPHPSHRRFFELNPPPPSGNSILVLYFHSENWAFETPLLLGISVNLPRGGHGYLLEPHITCTGCRAVLVLPIPSTVVTAMPSMAHNGSKQPFAEKCLSCVKFQLFQLVSIRCT